MTISNTNLVDDGFKVINKITGARNEDEKLIELDTLLGSTNESEISIANVYYEVKGTGTVKLQFENEEELRQFMESEGIENKSELRRHMRSKKEDILTEIEDEVDNEDTDEDNVDDEDNEDEEEYLTA